MTQPTLSAQLKELEAKLGVAPGRTHPVPRDPDACRAECGRPRARRALREVEEIRNLATSSQTHLQSTIRVGVVQSLGSYLLPLIVPGLHESHPDLKLYMREGLADFLLQNLANGTLDLLFFPLPVNQADFETLPIFREPIEVVLPHDHPYASKPRYHARHAAWGNHPVAGTGAQAL